MSARQKVWAPTASDGSWVPAEVIKQGSTSCMCLTLDGSELEVPLEQLEMREVLTGEGVRDLTSLSYLHEPAILDNLHVRFSGVSASGATPTPTGRRRRKVIYTYCGHICIAVNPYEWLRELYTPDVVQRFRGSLHEDNEPHIYAAAESAYSSMMTGVKDGVGNQSILVSGESGAGKTESVKIMMNYLAQAAGRHRAAHEGGADAARNSMSDVAYAVMKSNPLLEAFGNARTLRNDNSSRFGKFTRILFDDGGAIIGCRIDVYLLEKSRVVRQTTGERSFHIFYQLLCAPSERVSDPVKADLGLVAVESQSYLNQSGCTTIENVDDSAEYAEVAEAMDVVGMAPDEQMGVAQVVAAVLALGQTRFSEGVGSSGEMQAVVEGGSAALELHSRLLSCEAKDLASALISRHICARDEWYTIQLTKAQAEDSREALAKALYERLFIWLVDRVNASTTPQNPSRAKSTIGILDIFGFESFKRNSFEQLLINFANEKLQQQFTWYVFKLEQEEYNREGIQWTAVDFQDNQPVLDTIEGFGGVLALLDEESYLQRGCDENFINKLQKARVRRAAPSPGARPEAILTFPKMEKANFTIRHYAGCVEYCSAGFRAKNKDALHPDMMSIITGSKSALVQSLFPARPSGSNETSKGRMPTLAAQFKAQLTDLVQEINDTAVHYVRCIKPNQHASPTEFDLIGVHEQLRCQGILEAIRIARAAYPNRLKHKDIVFRYNLCLFDAKLAKSGSESVASKLQNSGDMRKQAAALMSHLRLDDSLFQIGKTKVFFKRAAMEELEASRARVIDKKLTKMQAAVRAWIGQRHFKNLKLANVVLQAQCRSFNATKRFIRLRMAAICIQSYGRVVSARNEMYRRRFGMAATIIQCRVRLAICHSRFLRLKIAAVVCQREARRSLAMRSYVMARNEAREELKLTNIVAKLQERLAEEMECRQQAEAEVVNLSSPGNVHAVQSRSEVTAVSASIGLPADSPDRVRQLEAQVRTLQAKLDRSSNELEKTRQQLREQADLAQSRQLQITQLQHCTPDGVHAGDSAQLYAGDAVVLKKSVDEAVQQATSALQLQLDSQNAELEAARVARNQEREIVLQREAASSQKLAQCQRNLNLLREKLAESQSSKTATDAPSEDANVQCLKQELVAAEAEVAFAQSAAVDACEKLGRYQVELVHIVHAHEDRNDLIKQLTLLTKQTKTQAEELARLREESTRQAAMNSSVNANLQDLKLDTDVQVTEVEPRAEELRRHFEGLSRAQELQVSTSKKIADAAVASLARSESADAQRNELVANQLARQKQEIDRLRREQQDMFEKLMRATAQAAACAASSGTDDTSDSAAVSAAKAAMASATDARIQQCKQQLAAAQAEVSSAVSRAELAELQLRNHAQDRQISQIHIEAQAAEQARVAQYHSAQTKEPASSQTAASSRVETAVDHSLTADAVVDELQQANAFGKQAMEKLASLEQLENARSAQIERRLENQQVELQNLLTAQIKNSEELQKSMAESAALKATSQGQGVAEAVEAATRAVANLQQTAAHDRVAQLEQELRAREAELDSATQALDLAKDTIRNAAAAAHAEKTQRDTGTEQRLALQSRIEALELQLDTRQSTIDSMGSDLADTQEKLDVALIESSIATDASDSSRGEQAMQVMEQVLRDSRVKALEAELAQKVTELQEARDACASLRQQLSAEQGQESLRSDLVEQLQQQQAELQRMRLQQLDAGKQLASTLGEVAAATQSAADPTSVVDAIREARKAASEAVEAQIGEYEGKFNAMREQLEAKEVALDVMKSAAKRKGEASMADGIRKGLVDEVQGMLSGYSRQMESQMEARRAEIERLHMEAVSERGSAQEPQQEEWDRQLQITRTELQAEREAAAGMREKLHKLQKEASDLQLLTASPARGAPKKLAEELARARSTIEEKNEQLQAASKKELLASRKEAELAAKKKSCEVALHKSKAQTRKLIVNAQALTQDVKRVEDVLGLRKETARPSSKELHNRLVAIVAALQQSAKSEQQIGEQTGQLTKFRQKLEDADLDELWKKHRGEDQKELLRMSNSICAAVRTQVFDIRKQLESLRKRVPVDFPQASDEGGPSRALESGDASEGFCCNGRQRVVGHIDFALAFVKGVVDTAQIRKTLNDATWELCKGSYGDGDVREFERSEQVVTMREQKPKMFGSPIGGMTRLVDTELARHRGRSDGRRRKSRGATPERADGVLGYVRRCFASCDERDSAQCDDMRERLLSLLQMIEAAGKVDTTAWDGFPIP